MYARAQSHMTRLRDMASRGMKSAAAAANKAAAEMKSVASSASSASPVAGGYNAFTDDGPRSNGHHNAHIIDHHNAQQHQVDINSPARVAMRLAERLDAGAAAAEILFDMRAHAVSDTSAGSTTITAEEQETLQELRATCEDHLNTLARVVESGGVVDDALLIRAIEVAESLVSAIGDDEVVTARDAADADAEGYAPPTQETQNVVTGGNTTKPIKNTDQNSVVDLLGGLDVGGGGQFGQPINPPATPAVSERPATEAEEDAMVAAAIAASLAESQETQQPEQPQQPQQTQSANLIDF